MQRPRRLAILTRERLRQLSASRLLSYRKQALSLENSPEESDYGSDDMNDMDMRYIWFKSDPRWKIAYDELLEALADAQRREKPY